MSKLSILICDELAVSPCLEMAIESLGYSVRPVRDGAELMSLLQDSDFGIAALLLGSTTPAGSSLDILRQIRAVNAKVPAIMIVDPSSTRDIVAAMKSGATDLLCRPVTPEDAIGVLTSALEHGKATVKLPSRNLRPSSEFKSANTRCKEIESRLGQIGLSGVPVLIQGETGSGKEVLARKLHAQSARFAKPFLKLNCAALPSELVESELFGYERGAFTGAFEKKAGIFELADGGTILLDEIGDMDIRLQAKLLQVLQDQEFRRIGGKESVKVNVRILAATHRDLEKAISDRSFREDLYYRLNVIVLQVPPLRERTEDIIPLSEFLIKKHADSSGSIPAISVDLRNALLSYNWPGNVRELENYMRKLVVFPDPDALAHDLQARVARRQPALLRPLENQVAQTEKRDDISILEKVTKDNRRAEKDAILTALDSTRWNRKQAAAILKTEYKSLLYKMKKLGIDDSPRPVSARPHSQLHRAASGD